MIGLRILHLATSFAAAKAGDVLGTLQWLKQQGHDIAIAAGGDDDIPGVTVLRYRSGGASWWLGGKRSLLDQVSEWRPDVIHLHGIAAWSAAKAIADELEVPVVVSIDEALPTNKGKALRDPVLSWLLVPTEAQRAYMLSRFKLPRDSVAQLPYAFDYEQLLCMTTREAHDPTTPPVLGLYAGNDDEDVDAILTQLDQMITADEQFTCIVGYDPSVDGEELEKRIRETQERPWCRTLACPFLGSLLPQIDIFIHAAGERRLAPLIAALGTGRPVIAESGAGIDELVRHEQTGVIVPAGDGKALRDAIREFLAQADKCEQYSTAAQSDARTRFALDIVGPALIELYHSAIAAAQHPESKGDGSRAYRRHITH